MTKTMWAVSPDAPPYGAMPGLPISAEARSLRAPKTILVVEDELIVARDLQRSLVDLGYDVPVTAASADQAITLATERCPDLVLMDIRIKGQRDGIETATILRKRFDVPIVYLTAFADELTLERAKATEPSGYLLKPVRTSELRSAVEIALFKYDVEKRLRERERWLTTTLRAIGDAVISTDAAGRINYMNPVAEGLTGWKMEKAHGRLAAEIMRLVHDDQPRTPIPNPLQMALDETRTLSVNGILVLPDGQSYFISDSTTPVVAENGSVLGAVMVFRDVGERRQLQGQLEMADRLATVGTMVAGVAHEVNNPLSYILANISFALDELQLRLGSQTPGVDRHWMSELETALADAKEGGMRVAKIVADLNAFTRKAVDSDTQTDLNEAISWSIQVAGHTLQQCGRVVRHLGPVPLVAATSGRLGQVFVNLLINAAHSLDPARRQTNEVVVTTRTDPQGSAVVEIRDTGCGMTPEVLEKIFEPFFTTKALGQGTGLGLSVTHGIVASLGGTIVFESQPGEGTLARLVLPCSRSEPSKLPPSAEHPACHPPAESSAGHE